METFWKRFLTRLCLHDMTRKPRRWCFGESYTFTIYPKIPRVGGGRGGAGSKTLRTISYRVAPHFKGTNKRGRTGYRYLIEKWCGTRYGLILRFLSNPLPPPDRLPLHSPNSNYRVNVVKFHDEPKYNNFDHTHMSGNSFIYLSTGLWGRVGVASR